MKKVLSSLMVAVSTNFQTIGICNLVVFVVWFTANYYRKNYIEFSTKYPSIVENTENIENILLLIYFICFILITFNFLSAGKNLLSFASNLMNLELDATSKLDWLGNPLVVVEENRKLIISKEDFGDLTWDDAVKFCKGYNYSGYNDWRLPTKEELDLIYSSKHKIGGFKDVFYWASDQLLSDFCSCQDFKSGIATQDLKTKLFRVRPVRTI